MRYGTIKLKVQTGSLSITKTKNQLVRHYPGTDINDVVSLGKPPSVITCTLIAESDTERILLEQILHGDSQTTLVLHNFYYKDVVTGEVSKPVPATDKYNVWYIDAEFTALDPIPYDVETDGALY